jgi:hypothetical protein
MRRAAAATSVAILLVLSACGSGPPPLTKAEWLSQANAICTRYNDKVDADLKLVTGNTRSDLVKIIDVLLADGVAQEKELKALAPPKEDKATVAVIFDQYEKTVKAVTDFRAAASGGDQTEVISFDALPDDLQGPSDKVTTEGDASDHLLDTYGAGDCGSGSGSSGG